MVRVVRRHIIVHRDLRAATIRCILRDGWHFAVMKSPGREVQSVRYALGVVLASSRASWNAGTALRPFESRNVSMLKGKHGLKGQDSRLATLTGARLNDEVVKACGTSW